jgi:hypothetical protein
VVPDVLGETLPDAIDIVQGAGLNVVDDGAPDGDANLMLDLDRYRAQEKPQEYVPRSHGQAITCRSAPVSAFVRNADTHRTARRARCSLLTVWVAPGPRAWFVQPDGRRGQAEQSQHSDDQKDTRSSAYCPNRAQASQSKRRGACGATAGGGLRPRSSRSHRPPTAGLQSTRKLREANWLQGETARRTTETPSSPMTGGTRNTVTRSRPLCSVTTSPRRTLDWGRSAAAEAIELAPVPLGGAAPGSRRNAAASPSSARDGGGAPWSMTHLVASGAPARLSMILTTSRTRRCPARVASTRSPTRTGDAGLAAWPFTRTCPPRHAAVAAPQVLTARTAQSHLSTNGRLRRPPEDCPRQRGTVLLSCWERGRRVPAGLKGRNGGDQWGIGGSGSGYR